MPARRDDARAEVSRLSDVPWDDDEDDDEDEDDLDDEDDEDEDEAPEWIVGHAGFRP